MKFRRDTHQPSYAEVEAPGKEKDSMVVFDPKQSFVLSDRRESEQKEGFIVPDQREHFLVSDSTWSKLYIPEDFGQSWDITKHRLSYLAADQVHIKSLSIPRGMLIKPLKL